MDRPSPLLHGVPGRQANKNAARSNPAPQPLARKIKPTWRFDTTVQVNSGSTSQVAFGCVLAAQPQRPRSRRIKAGRPPRHRAGSSERLPARRRARRSGHVVGVVPTCPPGFPYPAGDRPTGRHNQNVGTIGDLAAPKAMDGGARPSRATSARRIRDMSGHADERIRVHPCNALNRYQAARLVMLIAWRASRPKSAISTRSPVSSRCSAWSLRRPGSDQQPAVINGASELLIEAFGDRADRRLPRRAGCWRFTPHPP